MKAIGAGPWAVGSEVRYVRVLVSRDASMKSATVGDNRKNDSLWNESKRARRLALATAYSLQPTAWWSSQ